MYCSQCSCPACQAQRVSDVAGDKAKNDVVRLVIQAGEVGLTEYQMREKSRSFRALSDDDKCLLLDRLLGAGVLVKHTFKAPTRGKPRIAYLAVSQ